MITLLAACGSEARLTTAQFGIQANQRCTAATTALRRLPSPAPTSDDPLPTLVRNLLQWGRDTSMIVLVTPTATPDEVAEVRRAVSRHRDVVRYRFLDQNATKAQFDTIFAGSALVDSVAAADLPASFNIVVRPKANLDGLVSRFSEENGVQSVRTAQETVSPLISSVRSYASRASAIRAREADQLETLRAPKASGEAADALVKVLRAEAADLAALAAAARRRDQREAARLLAAAPGRTTLLSRAASRANLPVCGRSAWPTLIGAGRS